MDEIEKMIWLGNTSRAILSYSKGKLDISLHQFPLKEGEHYILKDSDVRFILRILKRDEGIVRRSIERLAFTPQENQRDKLKQLRHLRALIGCIESEECKTESL